MDKDLIQLFRKELIYCLKNDKTWHYDEFYDNRISNDKFCFWCSDGKWRFMYIHNNPTQDSFLLSDVEISLIKFYFLRKSVTKLAKINKKDKNRKSLYKIIDAYFKDNKAPLRNYKIGQILEEENKNG